MKKKMSEVIIFIFSPFIFGIKKKKNLHYYEEKNIIFKKKYKK
jgi:hypothetical protein